MVLSMQRCALAVVLTRSHLDGADHDGLVMDTAAFAARLAPNQAFVHFNGVFVANSVTLGPNHAGAEFVEDLKGGLVTTERKLALELNSGLTRYLRGHEIRAPKPRRERRVARLHEGASCQRCIALAAAAAQHHRRTGFETAR